jgi:ABC-type Na+ efflux pump permease subunit
MNGNSKIPVLIFFGLLGIIGTGACTVRNAHQLRTAGRITKFVFVLGLLFAIGILGLLSHAALRDISGRMLFGLPATLMVIACMNFLINAVHDWRDIWTLISGLTVACLAAFGLCLGWEFSIRM